MGFMAKSTTKGKTTYVSRHRERQRRVGLRRMEVAVKAKDAALVKSIVSVLRADGPEAVQLRARLRNGALKKAKTGADLLAILRAGALFGEETSFVREKSARPPVSFT
jgi:hypothetical protein